MRDIKFRAWDKKKKCLTTGNGNYMLDCIGNVYWQFGNDEPKMIDREDIELMQYTGLKDKNGAVGKIVWKDVPFHNSGYTTVGYIIESVQGVKVPTYASSDIHFYEVIGNIYQNPELLNDKNV